jgi:kinesin family member C2/C3
MLLCVESSFVDCLEREASRWLVVDDPRHSMGGCHHSPSRLSARRYSSYCVRLGVSPEHVLSYEQSVKANNALEVALALEALRKVFLENSFGALVPSPAAANPPAPFSPTAHRRGVPLSPEISLGKRLGKACTVLTSPDAATPLERETASLRARLEASEQRAMQANREAVANRDMLDRTEKERDQERDTVRSLQQRFEDMTTRYEELQAKLASESSELKTAQRELARVEKDLLEARKTLNESATGHESTEQELMEWRVKAASSEAELESAKKEVEALASKVDSLELELAEASEAKDVLEEELQQQAERHLTAQESLTTMLSQVQIKCDERSKRATALVQKCGAAHTAIRSAAEGMRSLSTEVRTHVGGAVADLSRLGKQLVMAASKLQTDAAEADRRFKRETKERRRAFNLLQEARGNIRVFARVRPVLPKEGASGTTQVAESASDFELSVNEACEGGSSLADSGTIVHGSSSDRTPKTFEFDRVFGTKSTQEDVYEEIAPVVMSAMDGFHVCIFAYGQTGSGKTHTMQGKASDPGVYHRALSQIFEESSARKDSMEFTITVSMVEIYNETVRDLLSEEGASSASASSSDATGASAGAGGALLDIKQGPEGVYLPGVVTEQVFDAESIHLLMERGQSNRSVGRTDANEHSSRSHSLLLVDVVGQSKAHDGVSTRGRLVLVDLAGSERVSKSGAEGQRMKEAQSINKSLSALGDVIGALTHKSAHVPYRNSKLTYLLQDSLGKDNKALMIVQVSPVAESRGETICSLNFASRVRKVEQGKARAHGDSGETAKLKASLKEAREQLRSQAAAMEGLKKQLKDEKDKASKASEKLRSAETTADKADTFKSVVQKQLTSLQKTNDSLKVSVVEAKRAAAAEKSRADRLADELSRARERSASNGKPAAASRRMKSELESEVESQRARIQELEKELKRFREVEEDKDSGIISLKPSTLAGMCEASEDFAVSPVADSGHESPVGEDGSFEEDGFVPNMLNDTFELRKSRGGKLSRPAEECEESSEPKRQMLAELEDESPAELAEGERTRNGTPGGGLLKSRSKTASSERRAAKGRLSSRQTASSLDEDDNDDDDDDEGEEFVPVQQALEGQFTEAEGTPEAVRASVHARFAHDLTEGTPEQLNSAPRYADRHAAGKSPAVPSILKQAQRRPSRLRSESADAPASSHKEAAARSSSSSKSEQPPPSIDKAASRSTSALLGSILRSSTRASIILSQSTTSNTTRSVQRKRTALSGGASRTIESASATAPRRPRSTRSTRSSASQSSQENKPIWR